MNRLQVSSSVPAEIAERISDAGIDLEPYMESALESVVETIMLYGEYPQPRLFPRGILGTPPRRKQFDLWDWLVDNISNDDRNEFVFGMTTEYRTHSDILSNWQKKIEKQLMEFLADSDMVIDKAQEYAEEA